MKNKNKLTGFLAFTAIFLNTNIAWAAENEAQGIAWWPFVLLAIVLVVFRKQLIAEATVEGHHEPHAEHKAASEPAKAVETAKPATASQSESAATEEVVDLTQNVDQCQGTTAKGTRCRRTANLETIEVNIDQKRYRFLTCKQHNNDAFTPFHFR